MPARRSSTPRYAAAYDRKPGFGRVTGTCKGMAQILEDIVVRKTFIDGADVLTWFGLHTSVAPPAPTANWSHIEDGKITAIRVTFDARSLAPPRAAERRSRLDGPPLAHEAERDARRPRPGIRAHRGLVGQPPDPCTGQRCAMQTLVVKSWWLDERAHAGEEHLDPRYVAGYDRKAAFDPTEDIEALKLQGLDGESIVLDLGAGTGTFAIAAARVCRHVVAVDVSPAMIEALHSRVKDTGSDNVTVVNAGFLSYEHHGEPADVIFTRNALHQLPDFWKAIALDRMASFLRPAGVLRLRDLVYDFAPADASKRIETWMAGAVGDPSVGFTANELAHHVRSEFSTYRWLLEAMLDRTGFDILDLAYVRSAYAAYTCRRRAS